MENLSTVSTNWLKYYITSGGKIWGVAREELLSGDAQQRRELIGNSFNTPEEAALAKAKLEASKRLTPYVEKRLQTVNGCPAIVSIFHLNRDEYKLLEGDIKLLAET